MDIAPILCKQPVCQPFVSNGWTSSKQKATTLNRGFLFGDPAGTRTQDHYIKSVMLYQLSYGIVNSGVKVRIEGAKIETFDCNSNLTPSIY